MLPLVYLDVCCLKRPFDSQADPLIRLQTEAVLTLQSLEEKTVAFVRSPALLLENSLNPVYSRRNAVDAWLSMRPVAELPSEVLELRIRELTAIGFRNFDAFHLASAELVHADAFLTVDIRLLNAAERHIDRMKVRVGEPVRFVEEIWQKKS